MRIEWNHQGRTFALDTPIAVRIVGPNRYGWRKILPHGGEGFVLHIAPSADITTFEKDQGENHGRE